MHFLFLQSNLAKQAELMLGIAIAHLAATALALLFNAVHTLDMCKHTWQDNSSICCLLLPQVPPNGLVVYTGTILTDEGKEKKVNIDFEPFKPINTSLYLCDNKFHTEALNELLESDNKYDLYHVQCCLTCMHLANCHSGRTSCGLVGCGSAWLCAVQGQYSS